jgi:hypothetical protein
MYSDEKALRFFLGVNTPQGFVSRYDQLTDNNSGWRTFIIKGGPGSGKSTLMKKVAAGFAGEPLELAHCSSDAGSIDAVICPGRKFALADGTSPHVLEPKYPGAAESILDLTSCWNEDALYACREDIIAISDRISRCHEHACRFLGAAASLVGDTYRLALDAVNKPKLTAYCSRLCEREFKATGGEGRESVRFLSAVTNKGPQAFTNTAKSLCERVYVVKDDCGAVSRILLNRVRKTALEAGHSLISCYCPLSPFEKLEHIFIPKLKLGFMTSNRFHDFAESMEAYRYVNSQRFSDQRKMKAGKHRITFNRKAAAQMLEQAAQLLAEAKGLHDELETYYIAATDFKKTDALTARTLEKLKKFPVI